MDRPELRFRILFEYYQEFHSENPKDYDARTKVSKIAVPDYERRAAQNWLIDETYVRGSNDSYGGSPVPVPHIIRINNYGINYVERVMDVAFTKIADDVSGIKELTRKERIERFARECLKNETTGKICKATLDVITAYMTSGGST